MNNDIDLKKLSREYLKSYYSINSYIGCSINCGYCFLAPIKIVPMKPIKVIDEKELIDSMIDDIYFVKNRTVISLNNRTDPFITEEVKNSTFKLLDLMDEKGLTNIVTITTKGLLDENDAKKLDKYKNIKVVIIVTYNGISFKIQPISKEIQENTMKNISQCKNVFLLHQFRPILPGVNDTEEIIRKVLECAKKYCDASIFQGVRVNAYIKERLEKREYYYDGCYDTHKIKSKDVDEIFDTIREEDASYPIFDHTSCALSYLFEEPDYNMHFNKRECSKKCNNYSLCHNLIDNKLEDLDTLLNNIGINCKWNLIDNNLLIDGIISDEQKSYIKHILHLNVKSLGRYNTYSERIMEGLDENKNNV